MSFLKKIFGKREPFAELQGLAASQDWAGVRTLARRLDRTGLTAEQQAQVEAWEREAGDSLAQRNLDEGAWAQQAGNLLRACDDYRLAAELACSAELRERAEQALAALERGGGKPAAQSAVAAAHGDCGSGCGPTCSPGGLAESGEEPTDLDSEARLELLLATMSPELAKRYTAAGQLFRQAWLAVQDGDDAEALALLEQVPPAERDSLFLFERGALLARTGENRGAVRDLQAALAAEPEMFPAFDALVGLLVAGGQLDELQQLLRASLAAERFSAYCWGRLAELHARRGELEPALAAGMQALEGGLADAGILALCAQLLERSERFDQAEALLKQLPAGGGCGGGGGGHPLLAEFWLRRGRNFDKALEAFKGALRQERDNPRWALRIAQVYHAKGWTKEAASQVERLLGQGGLPDELAEELAELAEQLR